MRGLYKQLSCNNLTASGDHTLFVYASDASGLATHTAPRARLGRSETLRSYSATTTDVLALAAMRRDLPRSATLKRYSPAIPACAVSVAPAWPGTVA